MATATNNYFYALGRRKSATARVRLTNKKGEFTINGKAASEYFAGSKSLLSGGGHASQVDAIRLGIAKALTEINEDYRGTLRRADLLGRDPREKERKKFGLKGARKKRQFTKR
jgi:small subunit ribosomal protein S9